MNRAHSSSALLLYEATAQRLECIFSDKTLTAIAQQRPQSSEELLFIPGIGPAQLEHYGDAVLNVIAQQEPISS